MIRISVIKDIENPKNEGRAFCVESEDGKVIGCKGIIVDGPLNVKYNIDSRFADFRIVWATTESNIHLLQNDFLTNLKPMKKIIHINKNIIQQNAKNGKDEPVCRVEENGKIRYCMEVNIKGPSRMVYSPNKPRKCGAKLWIETDADIELIGEKV